MRKGRWWLAGLALALLAACVGVWKWEERPPYKFLEGVRLSFVEAPIGSTYCRLTYVSARPYAEIHAAAKREASDGVWVSISSGAAHDPRTAPPKPSPRYADAFILRPGSYLALQGPRVPKGTNTIIWVYRKATMLDRARGWIYGLRAK